MGLRLRRSQCPVVAGVGGWDLGVGGAASRRRVWAQVALLAAVSFGCQPEDLSGSVDAFVYRLDPATRSYALERDTVENLESLRSLRGRDLDVRAASELNLGIAGDDIRRGDPFQLEWTEDPDG